MKILDKTVSLITKLSFNPSNQFNVGCFVFLGNKLISVGQNDMVVPKKKAFDFGRRFDIEHWKKYPFVHAELDAIAKLWGRHHINGKEKFVIVRLNKRGQLANAKPCNNCQELLSALNITKVWWSTEQGFQGT